MEAAKRVVWLKRTNEEKEVEGHLYPFKYDCNLFRSGRKWWLAYPDSTDHNTGSFKSKKKAIEWYERGGR